MRSTDLLSPERSEPPSAAEKVQRVLLAVNAPDRRDLLVGLCTQEGLDVQLSPTADVLLRHAPDLPLDLIVLDDDFDGISAQELCGDLRSTLTFRHTPIVVICAEQPPPERVAAGLLAGADDVCSLQPRCRSELRARIHVQLRNQLYREALARLRTERNHLRTRAATDSLTGALGRSALEAAISNEFLARSEFAVLFVDIDHFKKVNDTYGHQMGDDVLCKVVHVLQLGRRAGDACGRYGGEEFVLVLPGVNAETAARIGERHRSSVRSMSFLAAGGPPQVTISVGVAAFNPRSPDLSTDALLRRADEALYTAKESGRDRVVVATPAPLAPGLILSNRPAPIWARSEASELVPE